MRVNFSKGQGEAASWVSHDMCWLYLSFRKRGKH